ncbi:fibronectin type III domain-containing protein, partial [Shewanella fidelis]
MFAGWGVSKGLMTLAILSFCLFVSEANAITLTLSTSHSTTGSVRLSYSGSNTGSSCGYVAYEYKKTSTSTWSNGSAISNNQSVSFPSNGQYHIRLRNRLCITYPVNIKEDSYSNIANFTVDIPPPGVAPGKPINFQALETSGGVNLTWGKPHSPDGLSEYLVEQFQTPNWVLIARPSAVQTSFLLTQRSLTTLRIRAKNAYGLSSWVETNPIAFPIAPRSVTVPTSDIDGRYSIGWTAVSGATGYLISERKNGGSWTTLSSSLTGTSFTRSGLGNGAYQYKVKAKNLAGWGAERVSGSVTVLLPPPIPPFLSVPTSVSTNGIISMSWGASATATKYTLQESMSGGSWATISSSLSSVNYSRSGRATGSYTYRVKACNSSGCSGYKTSPTIHV